MGSLGAGSNFMTVQYTQQFMIVKQDLVRVTIGLEFTLRGVLNDDSDLFFMCVIFYLSNSI